MAQFVLSFYSKTKCFEEILNIGENETSTLNLSERFAFPCSFSIKYYKRTLSVSPKNNIFFLSDRNINIGTIPVKLVNTKNGEELVFFCNRNNGITERFKKFSISGKKNGIDERIITIGSGEENHITIPNQYVGTQHTTLHCEQNRARMTISGINGCYVNGAKRKDGDYLYMGDEISIAGVRIIFLGQSLAVNRLDLIRVKLDRMVINYASVAGQTGNLFPRHRPTKPRAELSPITLACFPANLDSLIAPALLGPIIILVLSFSFLRLIGPGNDLNEYFGALSEIISIVSIILGTFLEKAWAWYRRPAAYLAYIKKKEKELASIIERFSFGLNVDFPNAPMLIEEKHELLWMRNRYHPDFLCFRFGRGKIPFPVEIRLSKEDFLLYDDRYAKEVEIFKKKYLWIENAPAVVSYIKYHCVGVVGPVPLRTIFMQNFFSQLVMLHSNTDVHLVIFCASQKNLKKWEWLRWMPHVYAGNGERMIAWDEESSVHLQALLIRQLHEQTEYSGAVTIIAAEDTFFLKQSFLNELMKRGQKKFSFLLAYDKIQQIPLHCECLIEAHSSSSFYCFAPETITVDNYIRLDEIAHFQIQEFQHTIREIYPTFEGILPQKNLEINAETALVYYNGQICFQLESLERKKNMHIYKSIILVEIVCPILYKSYDFQLCREMKVYKAISDIVSILHAYEDSGDIKKNLSKANLFSCRRAAFLPPEKTLAELDIAYADRLILI